MSNNQIAVEVLLAEVRKLDDRKFDLTTRHETLLAEIRANRYALMGIIQNICEHPEQKLIPDWDYHKNVDDSYSECKICGKRL
jgi:hypothetical protein